jgi:hypothetical protein
MSLVEPWVQKPLARWLLAVLIIATVLTGLKLNSYKSPDLSYHTLQFAALNGGFDGFDKAAAKVTTDNSALLIAGLKLDFLFLLLYPSALSLACRLAMTALNPSGGVWKLGRFMSLAVLTAIPSDAIDNYTMLHYFSSGSSRLLLTIGALCTEWNFAIAGLAFLFFVGVVIWRLTREPESSENAACSFPDVKTTERNLIGRLRQVDVEQHKIGEGEFLGLAFSGGGIRSATFSLGIVQALADFRILRHVDYLSTVSGGGYIGSWLLARLKRTDPTIEQLEDSLSPQRSPDPNSEAWQPIQFLRAYSNYLTPQLGLFSADTWSIGAIWLRNTILIQSILILGLAGVLVVPRWLFLVPGYLSKLPVWGLVFLFTAVAAFLIFTARGLKAYGGDQTLKQWQILLGVVVPLFVLCCYSAVQIRMTSQQDARAYAEFVAVLVLFSLLIVQEGGELRSRSATEPLTVLKVIVFSLLSSALAGAITLVVVQNLGSAGNNLPDPNQWIVITVGPVGLVAAVSLVLTFHIGLLGRSLEDGQREWISRAGTWLNICAAGWLALFFTAIYAPLLVIRVRGWFDAALPALTIGWVISTAAGLFSAWSPKSGGQGGRAPSTSLKLVATYAPYVFVVGLLFLLSFATHVVMVRYIPGNGAPQPLFESWGKILSADGFAAMGSQYRDSLDSSVQRAGWLGFASVALLILAGLLSRRFDLNEFSMQYFYKNRLVRCYLGAAHKNREMTADRFTGFDPNDDILLNDVARRPYPIINTSLNLVHGKRLAWQERKATSFVMTPEYCGFHRTEDSETSWLAQSAYRPTARYGGKMYLGRAMAISGAAVNPNMGSFTSPATAFLMTVFNVRLGSWLGNPRNEWTWHRSSPRTGIFYLLCELLGLTNDDRAFVNLSDGGHFENLGIYELVHRRCKFIIACDGSQDSAFAFEDLGNAIRECRADFGAEIKIDVSRIRPDPQTGLSQVHCAVGRIKYPETEEKGYLLYIKTSLTGDEPADVLEYQKIHPEFPHQSTADQWFTESQFESYRRLGYDIGRKVFESSKEKLESPGCEERSSVKAFFKNLRETWYPPSARVDKSFSKHGEAFDRLAERLRSSGNLAGLAQEFYDRSWSENLESKFLYCTSLMQLMEDIYIDLNLEENFKHPDNQGWMNIFRRWWRTPTFQYAWKISRPDFGTRFCNWCETRLKDDP